MNKYQNLPCAFHAQDIVTHFCHCSDCMLPLCAHCIPIHQKQHLTMYGPPSIGDVFQLMDKISDEIGAHQQQFSRQLPLINRLGKSLDDSHKSLCSQIEKERDTLIKTIEDKYTSILTSVDEHFENKHLMLNSARLRIQQISNTLTSIENTFYQGKAMRSAIMWEVQNMYKLGLDLCKKLEAELASELSAGKSISFLKFQGRQELINKLSKDRLVLLNENNTTVEFKQSQQFMSLLNAIIPAPSAASGSNQSSEVQEEGKTDIRRSLNKLRNSGITLMEINNRFEQRKNMQPKTPDNAKSNLNTVRTETLETVSSGGTGLMSKIVKQCGPSKNGYAQQPQTIE